MPLLAIRPMSEIVFLSASFAPARSLPEIASRTSLSAERRRELDVVAILLRMRRGGVVLEGFLAPPRLDDLEVIRAHRVQQDVEADVAVLEPARGGELGQHARDLRIGRDVHVADHVNRLVRRFRRA